MRIPTQIAGFKDPAFQGTSFKKPLICIAGENLMLKEIAETDVVNAFRSQGIEAGRCMDIFLPTRLYVSSDTVRLISAAGFDSVILLKRTDTTNSQKYIPGSGTTHTYGTATTSPAFVQNFGQFAVVHGGRTSYESTSTTDDGYVLYRTSVITNVQFYDLKTQQMAWTGSSQTNGPSRRSPREFIDSIAAALRDELIRNGLMERHLQAASLIK